MSKFLVTPLSANDPSKARVIEADKCIAEEYSGALVFADAKGELVARLLNVNIERLPSGKQSSQKMSSLASKYINFRREDIEKLVAGRAFGDFIADIRSLAASVLSQDEIKGGK